MIKNKIWKKINYMPNYLISNFGDVINIKTNKTLKHQIKKRLSSFRSHNYIWKKTFFCS